MVNSQATQRRWNDSIEAKRKYHDVEMVPFAWWMRMKLESARAKGLNSVS